MHREYCKSIDMHGGSIPTKLTLNSYRLLCRWGGDLDRYSSWDLMLRFIALACFAALLLAYVSL